MQQKAKNSLYPHRPYTKPYHTIIYQTISCYTKPYHAIPNHIMPYHTIPYRFTCAWSISYHTISCHTIHNIPYHTYPTMVPCHTITHPHVPYTKPGAPGPIPSSGRSAPQKKQKLNYHCVDTGL